MHDEWSGFTSLLAELIEKHASELNLDDLPIPPIEGNERVHTENAVKVA